MHFICNLHTEMDYVEDPYDIFLLEQVRDDICGNQNVSATIISNLQKPEIQAEAVSLLGHVPTNMIDLAVYICWYLLPSENVESESATCA